ncbi:ATP-binding protein [Sessilibacter corallicola]|uniref:histidine kinase n=1 Tax=Sessilibacter corallicola TaxID=2904075 RepID=A0ABQ0AFH1_9GAMM
MNLPHLLQAGSQEQARLDALTEYFVLDTPQEAEFDMITQLAASLCGTPIALISLVDASRQWFKSHHGLESTRSTSRDIAFCGHAITGHDLMEIEDATKDPRFENNPLVLDEPHIRFYAGQPLVSPEGYVIGTLCVIDSQVKSLDESQRVQLKTLAELVMSLLDSHKKRVQTQLTSLMGNTAEDVYLIEPHTANILYSRSASQSGQNVIGQNFIDLWSVDVDEDFIANVGKYVDAENSLTSIILTEKGNSATKREAIFNRLQPQLADSPIWVACRPICSDPKHNNELSRLQNEFQLLAEASPAIVFKTDKNGLNTYVNKRWQDMTGLPYEECSGHGWAQPVHADDKAQAFEHWQNAVKNQSKWSLEFRFVNTEGNITWVLGQAHPIFDRDGKFSGHIGVCTDISRGVHEQKKLIAQQTKLSQTMRINYLGEMTTTIAHQLNQPLTAITNYAEVISDLLKTSENFPSQTISSIERIIAQASYASEVIQHVRRMIKRETIESRFLLNDVIQRLLKLLAEDIKASNVNVHVNVDKNLPAIYADEIQIEHVIINLIKNALESFEKKGHHSHSKKSNMSERVMNIDVSSTAEKMIKFQIEDNGVGIDEDTAQKVFTPFFSQKTSGLGLGLPMSQTIVESHGGRMWLASSDKGRTCFCFLLPISTGEERVVTE